MKHFARFWSSKVAKFGSLATISATITTTAFSVATRPATIVNNPSEYSSILDHYHDHSGLPKTNQKDLTNTQLQPSKTKSKKETITISQLSQYIDHTALKPITTQSDIKKLCNEAIKYNFKSVCISPIYVKYCSNLLLNTNILICTVIGFPLGNNTTKIKVLETIQAIKDGANEIDMVISIPNIKSNNWDLVELDIASVVQATKYALDDNNKNNNNKNDILVKVILETSLLTKDEIIKACKICVLSGANYVKTSTGFGGGGATIENVKLMKETVDNECIKIGKPIGSVKVKASGGIRNYDSAINMINAGASRIGASSGVKIMQGCQSTDDY